METQEERERRQRLSAQMTLEAVLKSGLGFRPMMEVTGADGEAAVLVGWPGHGKTPTERAMDLGIALGIAAVYAPQAVCVVLDARYKSLKPGDEELPSSFDKGLGEDPAAVDCLMLILSSPEGSRLEIMPYGRADDGRAIWHETDIPPTEIGEGDQMGRILAAFWGEEGEALRVSIEDDEVRHARLIAARMMLPGIEVYPLRQPAP